MPVLVQSGLQSGQGISKDQVRTGEHFNRLRREWREHFFGLETPLAV